MTTIEQVHRLKAALWAVVAQVLDDVEYGAERACDRAHLNEYRHTREADALARETRP